MKPFLHFALTISGVLMAAMAGAQVPKYNHIVVVMEENHSYSQIIGSAAAPNINALAAQGASIVNSATDPQGNTSGSHGVRHPSQPNYLELYSGSNQGAIMDGRPGTTAEPFTLAPPFTTPNLGASLRGAGFTFATYSQGLPSVGFDGDTATTDVTQNQYQRKHNPASNWVNDVNPTANQLPSSVNQPFASFLSLGTQPGGFANLPTVSFVIPDEQNDMHDGTITQADTFLKLNVLDTYLAWATANKSLLIVTWDEDGDNTASNQIPTIFAGAGIKPGNYTETNLNLGNPYIATPGDPGIQTPSGTAMNHYNVLSTIEDSYGLAHIGGSINRPAVTDVFNVPEPAPALMMGVCGMMAAAFGRVRSKTPSVPGTRAGTALSASITMLCILTTGTLSASARLVIAPNQLPDPNSVGTLPANQTYGDTADLFPFFPGAGNALRYQQVFAASQFSTFATGGENIRSLGFRVFSDASVRTDKGAFTASIPLIQFTLSTTTAAPDNLNTIFSSNTGADAVVVYGAAGAGSPLAISSVGETTGSSPAPFDISVILTTPFHYDPARGNLLLDVQNYSGTDSPNGIEFDGTFVDADSVSREMASGSAAATSATDSDTSGLVVKFTTIPEPSGGALVSSAVALLLCFRFRRRSSPPIL